MTLHKLFENRSGRVIAAFRAVLALVFLASLLLHPGANSIDDDAGRMLLGAYVAISLGLLALAWRSWWYDQLLAFPCLLFDVAVFLVTVFVTEGSGPDFTSPFLALFALITLSATLRWDWRAAAWTGLAVAMLFCAGAAMMLASDLPFDTYRFMRRALYTIALLPVLVWFGVQRREPQVPPVPNPPDGSLDGLMWRVLDYAQDLTGAQRGFIAWTHAEEPWTEIREEREKTRLSDRAGPQLLESWDRGHARVELFDVARGRGLVLTEDERAQQSRALLPAALSARSGISEGLLLPFGAASGEGIMLLGELRSPGVDLLRLGKAIAREAGTAFDRTAVGQMEREALVERTRSAIARDLHDSVAQSLAGACFRLEALRRNLRLGLGDVAADADRDIVSVRDALRQEQGHIRSLIETLRTPAQPQQHDLRADINRTLSDAGAHWGIAVALDAPGMVQVAGWLSHEVQQLVREAVANAARHGRAGRVTVRLGLADGRVNLHIQDDGVGFDAAGQDGTPWSISERVAAIGGDFSVESAPGCTRLAIVLPARETKG